MRLTLLGSALAMLVVGCAGSSDDASPTSTATAIATATSTDTPTITATASPSSPPTATATPDERLGVLAARAGVWVGAAFVEGSEDTEFRSLLASELNSTTAPLYWQSTQAQRGVFDFSAADAALAVAEPAGLRVRGHPLVWGRLALPEWVRAITDAGELRAAVTEQIQTVVGRYRGRIRQYDVVNEPLTFFGAPGRFGNALEDYVFSRVLGPGYIREALDIAHAADPDAELFVNELLVMEPGAKQDAFFALVQGLVESGAPLSGVGFQGHITPPFAPTYRPSRDDIAAAVARFAALGLRVEITELDVSLTDPASQLDAQAAVYADVFAGCFRSPGCDGVTMWGLTDRHTWIRNFFGVEAAPLMFDDDYRPKPAYFAARDVLRQLPAR